MQEKELLPRLFRTEYRKIVSVLCKLFGLEFIGIAEDITSDTFLLASETWGFRGVPENPAAWLYTVAKNKAKDQLKRDSVFNKKVAEHLERESGSEDEIEIDLSPQNITDSQLKMMFAICQPSIPVEAQIGLSLRILCGFGIDEVADAFLTNKETINKRLFRARDKLRTEKIKVEFPGPTLIEERLETVARTLYLLFNEGYYSAIKDQGLRKDLCLEAMRLCLLLTENESTNKPSVNALLSLMCFHASRFDARTSVTGEIILYEAQDENLWDKELVKRGEYYLNQSAIGFKASKYHFEAGIAYWHTIKEDSMEKWENILQYYNRLLQIEYSPVAALNRTYALSKANGKEEAIKEAEKLQLHNNHLYYSLLGELYTGIDSEKALNAYRSAYALARSDSDRSLLEGKIRQRTIVDRNL